MDITSADNIIALANLGKRKLELGEAIQFLQVRGIGTNGFFNGVRLADTAHGAVTPWLCFTEDDVKEAKKWFNPPKDSEELMQAAEGDTQKAEKLWKQVDAMFMSIQAQPWRERFLESMKKMSIEANEFLQTYSPAVAKDKTAAGSERLLDFMNKKIQTVSSLNNCLFISKNDKDVHLDLKPGARFSNLEEEVAAKFYLAPYLAGNGLHWRRTKICKECGNFFLYTQERARYCSQKCRMAAANKARRSK